MNLSLKLFSYVPCVFRFRVPHKDPNETTQPIPATSRTSGAPAEPAGGQATMGEVMPAVPSPVSISAAAPDAVEEEPYVDEGEEGDEEEEEDDDEADGGTGRLIMIGVGVMLLLGALWFAWTKFGAHKTP